MKKFFAFAIAAVTMTVGCQKIQDLVNPNASVDDTDLVEIKFASSIATVTKSAVEDLNGLTVKVYGINDTKIDDPDLKTTRFFVDEDATATTGDAGYNLSLTKTYYYNNNDDLYSFYGYYLDGATTTGDLKTAPYEAEVAITGEEDILLATVENNGTFSGSQAKLGTHPNLMFNHALSQFKFSAVNIGASTINLTGISIATPTTGTMNVTDATITAGETNGTINVTMDQLSLNSNPGATDYQSVVAGANEAVVMVMPNASYKFTFTVMQGTEERRLQLTTTQDVVAGTAYEFQIKLSSLTEIVLTAELAEWGAATIVPIDPETDGTEL